MRIDRPSKEKPTLFFGSSSKPVDFIPEQPKEPQPKKEKESSKKIEMDS